MRIVRPILINFNYFRYRPSIVT